ncbi:MAG: hypothetical protein MJ231_04100, partial [bacterium]|nr:hypothetical protein [bacterium]
NNNGEIVFLKCDCEGSGKPSVLSMWGSCFSVFNAIDRDVKTSQNFNYGNTKEQHMSSMKHLKETANQYAKQSNYKKQEDTLNYAIEKDKAFFLEHPDYYLDYEPHYLLGYFHECHMNFTHASSCYNNAINYLSKYLCECVKPNIKNLRNSYEKYESSMNKSVDYDNALKEYNNQSMLYQLFNSSPQKPSNYGDYKYYKNDYDLYQKILLVAGMFDSIGVMCKHARDYYPAYVCYAAADDIRRGTDRGYKILEMRSRGVQYLGDLYPEIKESDYENI